MSKGIVTLIKIEVKDIKVVKDYYSFKYKTWVNGKLNSKGTYSSDHNWNDNPEKFKAMLSDYYAAVLVNESIVFK